MLVSAKGGQTDGDVREREREIFLWRNADAVFRVFFLRWPALSKFQDLDGDGQLRFGEFLCAMHLAERRGLGEMQSE